MTTKSRILAIALSVLMFVSVVAPLSVLATSTLDVPYASANNGNADNAINYESPYTAWYSAQYSALAGQPAIATYTLGQTSTVSAVSIAFYKAEARQYTFSVEYSTDGEAWNEALASTTSATQAADQTSETFTFATPVIASYIRVIGTATTGSSTAYFAYYLFEAIGTVVDGGTKAAADFTSVDAALDAFDALAADEALYTPASWAACEAIVAEIDALGADLDYTYNDLLDEKAAALLAAIDDLDLLVAPLTIAKATQVLGALHTNSIYHAAAAVPNLRAQDGVWWSASCVNGPVEGVFCLTKEAVITSVVLDWYKGDEGRIYEYSLYYSMDNVTWTELVPSKNSDAPVTTDEFAGVNALYIKLRSEGGWVSGGGGGNHWIAIDEISIFGETVEGGLEPNADYTLLNAAKANWANIAKDLTESMYTTDSWAAFLAVIDPAIEEGLPLSEQPTIDAAVTAMADAYSNLQFTDEQISKGIEIAQSYYTGDFEPAWTNGALLFTEPGYVLTNYKVNGMGLATWTRIFAAPDENGDLVITMVKDAIALNNSTGIAVSEDEIVPAGGFVLALHRNSDDELCDGSGSQYASQEFGNRNYAAFLALELAVGDKVQLNNVIWTEDQFAEEGEDPMAAWLETEGEWQHRYWDKVGAGEVLETPIYRTSNRVNTEAVEGGPQYLARDWFVDFVSYSTLTKVADDTPDYVVGDCDGNGEVGNSDLLILATYLAGHDVSTDPAAADCDGNGEVGNSDLLILATYLAGHDVSLG